MVKPAASLLAQRLLSGALLLMGASAALWFVVQQQRRDTHDAQRAQIARRIFTIEKTTSITHIVLETSKEGVFELVRDGERDTAWHLVAPRTVLAEASTVEAMLKEALALEQTQTISPTHTTTDGSNDLTIFGLSPPQYRLALTTGGAVGSATSTQSLAIGKRNKFDGSLFVQRDGAAEIALVPGSFIATVDRNLYKLRDKRVALIDAHRIQRLIVDASSHGAGYTIVRQGAAFYLQKPVQAQADSEEVEAIITALCTLRGKRVVAESAKETQLSLFGLQSPRFSVRLWLGAYNLEASAAPVDAAGHKSSLPAADVQLLLGEMQIKGVTHTFARTADADSPVWELGSDWVTQKLRQDAAALRDMHVVHVDVDKVARINVLQEGKHQSFVRARDAGGAWGMWRLAGDSTQAIHPSLVAALLMRTVDLRADRIVAESVSPNAFRQSGLHKPHFEVDLLDDGEHLLAGVVMGASDKDGVFVTTDEKLRLDHIGLRAHDDLAVPQANYLDTDSGH